VDCVMAFARAAKEAKAQRFIVISSAGADAQSKNFYLRTKGEMENAVASMGFPATEILQPGLLMGLRSQMRPLELGAMAVMPLVNPFLRGPREAFRCISVKTVAAAIVGATRSGRRGVTRYTYSGIHALTRLKSVRTIAPDPKVASNNRQRGTSG
jgi:uncharacterized protein YbjT (DUF2867 family)